MHIQSLAVENYRDIKEDRLEFTENQPVIITGLNSHMILELIAAPLYAALLGDRNLIRDSAIAPHCDSTTSTLKIEIKNRRFDCGITKHMHEPRSRILFPVEPRDCFFWHVIDVSYESQSPVALSYGPMFKKDSNFVYPRFGPFRLRPDIVVELAAIRDGLRGFIPNIKEIIPSNGAEGVKFHFETHNRIMTLEDFCPQDANLFALVSGIIKHGIKAAGYVPPRENINGVVLLYSLEMYATLEKQYKILPNLVEAFPNIQFFITTESPLILGSVKSDNMFLGKEAEDTTFVKFEKTPTPYGFAVSQILSDYFGMPERRVEVELRLANYLALFEAGDFTSAQKLEPVIEKEIGPNEFLFARTASLLKSRECK